MKPLFTEEEFGVAKGKQLLPLSCEKCGKTFYETKTRIKTTRKLKPKKMRFCSHFCSSSRKITTVNVVCDQCGMSIQKPIRCIKRTKHNFCSKSCAAKYHNKYNINRKSTGSKRSKLEVWLESQLTSTYPKYEFHFNRRDAINAELDIYIPELKLAFELNGIFHYEPIYGQDKLDRIQTNDTRRMQACYEKGIELCIIDTSKFTYFKPDKAQKYLNIITKIMQEVSVRDCDV